MSWQDWILVSLFAISTLVSIATVGEQRTPTTPKVVTIITVLNSAMIALVVTG